MNGAVRVVARTNPFLEKCEEWEERHGANITRLVRRIDKKYRRMRIAVQVNGKPIPISDWDSTRVHAGDLVNLKVVPQFGGSPVGTIAGAALGIGSLAALWLLQKAGGNSNTASSATANNNQAPPPIQPPDPPLPPQDQYGGAQDTIVPPITGVANRTNNWGPIPNVYGTTRVYPVVVAQPYFTVIGPDQYCYAVLSFGVGQLDISSIKLGDILLDTLVAQGLAQYEVRYGSPSDINTALTLYTQSIYTVSPNINLPYNTTEYDVAGNAANFLSIDITFPNGLYGSDRPTYDINLQGVTIAPRPATDFYGNVAQTATFQVDYRVLGSGSAWTSFSLPFTDTAPYAVIKSYQWPVPTQDIYEVRVTRTSADTIITYDTAGAAGSGVTYHHFVTPQQTCQWTALKSIRSTSPVKTIKDANGNTYPMTYIALKIKASSLTNGQLQNLSAICKRYLKTYNGTTWTAPVLTNNPAWAFVDVITGFINNGRLSTSYVDANQMKTWADFCDTNGFTYSKSVETFTTIEDLLDEICSHGQASRNVVDGIFTVVIDKPRTAVVQMFTQANTDNFEWDVDYPEYPDGVKIKFRNPGANYAVDERTVYADGHDITNSSTFEDWDFAGMTDATAAYKTGRYLIAALEQRPIKYSFDCDPQHLVCKRGDLVGLNYDVSFDSLGNGLISSTTNNGTQILTITPDQPVTMVAGQTYGVQIRLSDGSFPVSQQVNTVAGTTQTLAFTTPYSMAGTYPKRGDLVSFGLLGQETRQCLVDSIEHRDDLMAHITLVDYSPSIYNASAGAIPAYTPNVAIPHPAIIPTITKPTILDPIITDINALLKVGNNFVSRIQISLQPPQDSSINGMQVEYRLTGTTQWITASSGPVSNVVFISGVVDGNSYDVHIRYASGAIPGLYSDWTERDSITVIGQKQPPPDVNSIHLQGTSAIITYDATVGIAVPINWAGYEVRYAQGTQAIWDDMQTVTMLTSSNVIDMTKLPKGALVLGVKAVNAAGVRSTNACYLYQNVTNTFLQNLFLSYPQSPGWNGTIINGTVVGGQLQANSSGSLFWGASGSPFYNVNPSSTFYGVGYLTMQYQWTFVPDATLALPFTIFLNYHDANGNLLIQADQFFVEYKRNSQTLFYNSNAAAPFYNASGSAPFYTQDPNAGVWLPYPQEGIQGSHEQYTFRITCLASSARQPTLMAGIGVTISVPTVSEDIDQIIFANSGAGTAVNLVNKYPRGIKQAQVTVQTNPSYPLCINGKIDITKSPPVAYGLDASGNVVDGELLITVRGI